MEFYSLDCQVCLTKSNKLHDLKSHLHTWAHQKKMKEVFQEDVFRGHDFFPYIVFVDRKAKRDIKHPIIGLSLLTLCFSRETETSFYLCHVCEDKRPPDKILGHLFSHDHYSNYFNYTDPSALSFSWMPSMDMKVTLRPQLTKEVNERGSGTLQLLALPGRLMKKLDTSTYPEVMHTLSENDKLLKLFEATKPKRMMIQTYQRESTRKHPLLGMQHIVECICVGPTEKRYYLCTLCGLTLANHVIIKHVLSFDHIFCYFKAWHPSTLLAKECYKDYTKSFASMVLDFAKQTQEIHGTADTDMKQVSLEPAKFTSVNFTCYTEALTKLASITKEKNGSSLIATIKPGNRLEHRAVSAGSVLSYKLCCQDCKLIFETISQYLQHLSEWKHKLMLKTFLSNAEKAEGYYQTGWKPTLGLYRYLQESKKQNRPVIGLSLVVACVCTQFQADPIYVCFACQDCVSESCITQHLKSQKHLIHTLLYQNPWQLPFAWENHLDVNVLKSLVLEEEEKQGQDRMMLKILDISYQTFQSLIPPSYRKVLDRLQLQHCLFTHFMYKVPQCETHKLKENERFPLLGKHFMVMHEVWSREHQSTKVGYLCLLCERSLSYDECNAHVFSREHVAKFLDRFHPGSQTSSTDAETLLDLAKQAAHTHSITNVQVVKLDKPIWEPYSYHTAISILTSVKRRHGGGALKPPITPQGKLVPRVTLKEDDMDNVIDNSQKNSRTMAESENITRQKSTDNNNTPKTSVTLGSEMINIRYVKSEENSKKGADKETPTSSDKESERREALSKTCPDQVKSAGGQLIKEEPNTEEPTPREPSGKIPESCQNTDKGDGAETGKDTSRSSKDVLTQLKIYMCKENERKRPNSMSEKSKDTYSDEAAGRGMGHKRQRLTTKENTACEEAEKKPSGGLKGVATADKGESGKPSHETTKDNAGFNKTHKQAAHLWQYVKKERASREPVVGLSEVIECHCDQRDPIYLCECCFLIIEEKNIVSHVTGFEHWKVYLVESQNHPSPSGKQRRRKMRLMAAEHEKQRGCGNAQVVDLDEETYNKISKQAFHSAIKIVMALQAQQDSGHELPATTALPGVQPALASGPVHAQHEVCSMKDNIQVVKNAPNATVVPSKIVTTSKIVGTSQTAATSYSSVTTLNKSMTVMSTCTAKSSSCTTATTKSTATVSRLAATTSSCTTATTKLKETVSIYVAATSLATATTTKLTTANPLSSRTTSQTAATSYSSVTTPNKSLTVMSTCTAKSSSCTTATTKSTATVSRLAATASSSTATTNFRETTNKSTATSSSATATTKSLATTTICTATPSKYTAASYKLTGTTSTSSVTISSTTSTMKSSPVSRPLESGTRAGSRITATSCKAAPTSQTGSTVVCEATCRTTPSPTASKVTVTCETTVTNASAATGAKMPVKCENTEASAKTLHMKNAAGANADVAPHIHKSNPPAAPHLTTAMSVRSEDKNPPTEPPDTSTTKTKPNIRPKVGVNHLIIVLCEQRQQVYCQLCSVKLSQSNHLYTTNHQYNYVKMTYPGWTAKLSESGNKLDRIVALLAEVEKDVGSRAQILEVTNDVYDEISDLPKDNALERLKTMLKERDLQVSTTDTCEALTQHVGLASPHEVSDDEMYRPQDEPPGLSTNSQLEQENKYELQKLLSMPEMKSNVKEEADQSDRAQSWTDKGLEANDLIPDQPLSCLRLKSDPDPIPAPSIQDGDMAVTIRSERIEPDVEAQAHVEVTPAIQSPAVEKPLGCAVPLATNSESAGTFSQLPHACEETLESRQQEERSDPDIQATEKTSPVISFSPDLPSSAATVNTEQQNQSKSSLKAEHVLKRCGPGPGQQSTSQVLPSIPIGARTQGCSHLSTFLSVKGLDTQPIIGLGLVWECRGTPSLDSFFLCESCEEMLFIHDICQHMVSLDHQFKYLMKQYTQFLSFWTEVDLLHHMKLDVLEDIVRFISGRERVSKMDAQGVLLSQELYESVRRSPFSEAIKIVQNIKEQQQLSVCFPPVSTPQQRGATQKTEKRCLEEETAMAGGLDGVKRRIDLSPLDVTHVSLKADSVVSPFPGAGACLSPQETCRILRPPVSQHLKPIAEVQVKQAEVHSESQSFCTVNPKTAETPSVSPRDKCLPTRKRSAETPVETLVTSCTNNPQLEDPLPAKCTRSSLQQQCQPSPEPASGSTSVNPAAPEAKAVSTTLPSASINAQSTFGNVAINRNTGQISQPQGNTQIDTSEVNHLPIIPIRTTRSDPTKQKFMGVCKGHTKVNTGREIAYSFSMVETANPSNTLAAPGAYGQYSQMGCVTNEHSGHLSSQAVVGYTIPYNPPGYTGSLYQHQGHTASGFYPSQSYPGQESVLFNLQTFGHSSAAPVPPGWVSMQDQLQQQQYASWTTATLAAADGKVTKDAAFSGAVSFTAPTNSSQRLIHLNEYVPTQYSNNIIAQNTSQVCFGPQLFYYPTANAEHSFFVSGTGAFTAAPSMANFMPPTSQ